MEAEFEFAAEGEEHSNGGEFGFFWAGLEIGFVEGPVGVGQIGSGGFDGGGELSVDEERETCAGNVREGGAELRLGDHREAVDARMN